MGLDGEMTPAMIDEVTGILAAAALSSEAESDDYYNGHIQVRVHGSHIKGKIGQ